MNNKPVNLFTNEVRSEWVRLQTLILLRWMAISGQTIALIIAIYAIRLDLNAALCFAVIGVSALFNLLAGFMLPVNKRLSQRAAFLSLLFDLTQLVILLYLTGGLTNPFSLLLLAPVTISATALTMNATISLGGFAICGTTFLVNYYIPLTYETGEVANLPPLFLWGNWFALLIGFVFLSGYARRVTVETFSMSQALAATQMALDREHKLTVLGGVVAAAAHEMGTPFLKNAPITEVLREAAEPHENRGKEIVMLINGNPITGRLRNIPSLSRQPEILHGLRNLVQNAVDFAKMTVWIDIIWTDTTIRVLVADDGKGYPQDFLGRIGDPFLRRHRVKKDPARPDYEGMGLGLFIAKTLLERTGATLTFANAKGGSGSDSIIDLATGAMVSVSWDRSRINAESELIQKNQPVSL